MADFRPHQCPECQDGAQGLDRRDFMRLVGGSVAGLVAAGPLMPHHLFAADAPAAATTAAVAKPAEDMIRELFAMLSADQKKELVLPWDHGGKENPARLQTYNRPINNLRIGDKYTPAQQDLIKRTLKSVLSGEESFERLSRHGKWDSSGSFEGNGVVIFGDPSGKDQFSWVFSGHHLTLRCDGNSQPNAAFGGPMYYGHSANGYSDQNVYNYQTQKVHTVFDSLSAEQRAKAVVIGEPGDGSKAIQFRGEGQARPGIVYAELSEEQRGLVQGVMRTLLDPFRKEDGDEVMELLKTNGGIEKLHLAFYKDDADDPNQRWHYWRLEGPGFVWNYRVLPHVHCFVNIAGQA